MGVAYFVAVLLTTGSLAVYYFACRIIADRTILLVRIPRSLGRDKMLRFSYYVTLLSVF